MNWKQGYAVAAVLGQREGQYYGPHMMDGGWWWMWIMWIGGFFLFLLLVYFLMYGFRYGGRPPEPPRETPLDILKKRYARGEISREEYEEIRKDLEG